MFIKDRVTQLASFKAGDTQAIAAVATKDATDLQAMAKYNSVKYPTQLFGMASDSAHPGSPFAAIKVRRALVYALDNAVIAKAVGFGLADLTNQFAVPGNPIYNAKIVGYPYNPDKAKQLLSQAGYPKGFDITIAYNSTSPDKATMFGAVQGYLSAVGINAKLDAADASRFNQLTSGGWSNQLVFFWVAIARGIDTATSLRAFMKNRAFFYTPKSLLISDVYQAAFNVAGVEQDPAKSPTMFQEVQRIVIDDYCMAIPIMAPATFNFETTNVHDLDMYMYTICLTGSLRMPG